MEFDHQAAGWGGAIATVTESPGDHVWGCVWQIQKDQLHNLDKYEKTSIYIFIDMLFTL